MSRRATRRGRLPETPFDLDEAAGDKPVDVAMCDSTVATTCTKVPSLSKTTADDGTREAVALGRLDAAARIGADTQAGSSPRKIFTRPRRVNLSTSGEPGAPAIEVADAGDVDACLLTGRHFVKSVSITSASSSISPCSMMRNIGSPRRCRHAADARGAAADEAVVRCGQIAYCCASIAARGAAPRLALSRPRRLQSVACRYELRAASWPPLSR